MSAYHKAILALIALVLMGSIGLRAWAAVGSPTGRSAPPGALSTGQSFTADDGDATEEGKAAPQTGWKATLPAVTEGSFFALIGFGLGYTTRKLFKIGLVLLALGFVALQVLVHFGAVEVDWSAAVAKLNELVLNVREQGGSLRELLSDRVPAVGGIATGYFLGLRRG
jgi:uncharacterized membrane protein (Fun14 family)